jgi:DNA-binding response OmpR family regulator
MKFMRKKILVVDDNAELVELLRLHLKAAGFAIATATNGIEALKKARSVSPDLVLLDLGLPELDGLAVYETLRNTPATAAVPILIVTGLPDGLARYAGLDAHHCEFVSKPVNPRHLISRIKDLLRPRRGPCGGTGCERGRLVEAESRTAAKATERCSAPGAGSRVHGGQLSGSGRRSG